MNNRNGPEFAPLKDFIKTYQVQVRIFDKNDNEIRSEQLDYGIPKDRIWLGKLSYWAWSNGYIVETCAAD